MTTSGDRIVRLLLGVAAILGLAALTIAISGGGTVVLGGIALRAHNPWRPLFAAAILAAAALMRGRAAVGAELRWWWLAIERHAAAGTGIAALAAVYVGLAWGTFAAGGSDSYCYLNQGELFARADVRDIEPLGLDATWPGNVWAFAPAGHVPSTIDPPSFVPICPPGYPLMLAGARLAFGRTGMFWVTPLLGGLAVALVFVLARRIGGPAAGLLAALLTASSPIFLYQIVQPMNDVPAAALWCAALVVASDLQRPDRTRALATGLLCGLALTVRPNLAPLAVVTALGAALLPPNHSLAQRAWTILWCAAAAVPGILVVMGIQQAMHGSAFRSGYGDLGAMFSTANVGANLQRYPRWLLEIQTPIVLAALAAPIVVATAQARRLCIWLLGFVLATAACYLPYVVYDAWWYTRFLLPAVPVLLALTAAVVVNAILRLPIAWRAVTFCGVAAVVALLCLRTAERRDVFRLREFEALFRATGGYAATLPPNAAFITAHHSGAIRYYSGKSAFGWTDIDAGRLGEAIAFLRRHGRVPYLLLQDWEEPAFKARFASEPIGTLAWPPVAEIGGAVRVYDPADFERHRRGEAVRTATVPRDQR